MFKIYTSVYSFWGSLRSCWQRRKCVAVLRNWDNMYIWFKLFCYVI